MERRLDQHTEHRWAAAQISDEDPQALVDASQLGAEAPEGVLDRLREAHQDARAEQTRAGLVELDPPAGPVAEVRFAAAPAPVGVADPERYEEAHQQREDWVAEYGAKVAAEPPAAAELARREAERADRPLRARSGAPLTYPLSLLQVSWC